MTRLLLTALAVFALAAPGMAAVSIEVDNVPRRTWGGTTLEPQVRLVGTAEETAGASLDWQLIVRGPERVVGSGSVTPSQTGNTRLTVPLPSVRSRTEVKLSLELAHSRKTAARQDVVLDLFPRELLSEAAAACRDEKIGLVAEAEDDASSWLAAPLPWQRLDSAGAVAQFRGRMIFLVSTRRWSERSDMVQALRQRVDQGATLICLGREAFSLPLPRIEIKYGGAEARTTRALAPGHMLLAGLRPGDLGEWGRSGIVARSVATWPRQRNCAPVLDLPGEKEPRLVMCEWGCGAGRVLFCGLALQEQFADEPVAQLMLANLVRWSLTKPKAYEVARPCFPAETPLFTVLREAGAAFGETPGAITLADDTYFDGSHAVWRAALMARGGTVLFFHLSSGSIESLNEMLRRRWEADVRGQPPRLALAPVDPKPARVPQEDKLHALLAGAWPEDVAALLRWPADVKVSAVAAQEDGDHFRPLIEGGGLTKLERDGVRLIFWQLPLQDAGNGPQERVLAALLTQLGVRLAPVEP